jgi:hypothetical protein
VVIAVVKLLETRAALAMHRVTRSAGIGSAISSALELGVPMYMDSVIFGYSDGLKRWAYGGGSSHFYRRLDGEGDVGEKAAEECPPHEERSATA